MRIKELSATNIPPVDKFEAAELSDLVVIAGPNGVGKTRLINTLLGYFKQFNQPNVRFLVEATCSAEGDAWGKSVLDTSANEDVGMLRQTLTTNQRRRNFRSSVVYYESDRSIQNVKALQFEWEFADPWEEQISWETSFNPLRSRWQDTIHAIFKKIQSQKSSIASRAIQLRSEGHKTMNLEFSDPLDPFRTAFSRLLGPKSLVGADVQRQRLIYSDGEREDDVASLSSGEREVLNITFDFILRKPANCVVFFDEPELHLHPELLSKLITTLKTVGDNNQFFLITHSPSVISSSLDDTVLFLTPPKGDGENQALRITPNDSTSTALQRLGQSIGVVALGRKIVLIEGADSSLDKQTYGHILDNAYPDLILLPAGGKDQLISFNSILDDVVKRTIWGVAFFMLADRDAAPQPDKISELEESANGRFKTLSKYHLENYFLNPEVLAHCFEDFEPVDSWLRDPQQIDTELLDIASSFLSYAVSLVVSKNIRQNVGNVDVMPKGLDDISEDDLVDLYNSTVSAELARVTNELSSTSTEALVRTTYQAFRDALSDGTWRELIPGKSIFSKFAGKANIQTGRLKTLYITKNAEHNCGAFDEIVGIFAAFSAHEDV